MLDTMRRITVNGSTLLLKKVSFIHQRCIPSISRGYGKCLSNLQLEPMRAFDAARLLQTSLLQQVRQRELFTRSCSSIGDQKHQDSHAKERDERICISVDRKTVTIADENGNEHPYNAVWLRDHCCCSICVDLNSGQNTTDPADLDPDCTIQQVYKEGENLNIKWVGDEHVGIVGLEYLARNSYSKAVRDKVIRDITPMESTGELPRVTYEDVTSSGEGIWRWIHTLNEHGICIVEGVPPIAEIKTLAAMIGKIKESAYGDMYVVIHKGTTKSISDSTKRLPLHMDTLCYEAVPGFFLLLAREFDDCVTGGESIFVDAWRVAEKFRQTDPEHFAVLSRVPATFLVQHEEGDRDKRDYLKYRRPHFSLDRYTDRINGIFWHPISSGALCAAEEDIQPYYEAYIKFAKLLKTSDTKMFYRMKKGDMLSINNGRYMHARNAYEENGGNRILEGCFLCGDSVKSRAQVYSNLYNNGKPVKHVFNQDAF